MGVTLCAALPLAQPRVLAMTLDVRDLDGQLIATLPTGLVARIRPGADTARCPAVR